MSTHNPYAPPQSEIEPPLSEWVGTYRDGKLVRMVIGGRLPDRCVRCNARARGYRVDRVLYWRPAWWRWTIWVSLPLLFVVSGASMLILGLFWLAVVGYAVADIFLRRRIVVEYGLCERHRRLRSGVMGVFVTSWLLMIGVSVAVAGSVRAVEAWWLLVIAPVMFVLAIVMGVLYRIRLIRLTEDYMWLQGTGRPFYEGLPATSE